MKIFDILKEELVISELRARTKKEALEEMAKAAAREEADLNHEHLFDVLLERERLGSTGIGDGVAIPHGKLPGLERVIAVFARSIDGVEFDSMDGKRAHLFFLLVAPEDSAGIHLRALARVSRLMKEPRFRMSLMEAKTRDDICRAFAEEDAKY